MNDERYVVIEIMIEYEVLPKMKMDIEVKWSVNLSSH